MNFEVFKERYNIKLNDEQEAAVQSIEKPTLLLSVPGSGKTTVIVARVGYLILCNHVDPRQILTLTFNKSAANDMKKRFSDRFPDIPSVNFRTIHSFCAGVIKLYENTMQTKAFTLKSETGGIVADICRKNLQIFPSDNDISEIQSKITYVKNMMMKKNEIEQIMIPDIDFAKIYQLYNEYMVQNEWMDYDDQLRYAFNILRKHINILEYFRQRFAYINVDEAQDTSLIQHEIIKLLAGGRAKIFMVGDEDQSIYSFRAAYPKALLDFDKTYQDAKILKMQTNYRSTGVIIEHANRVIKRNFSRIDKTMVAHREYGKALKKTELKDLREQYQYIANIAEQVQGSLCILYRNNDSAIPLMDVLQRRGIPFKNQGESKKIVGNFVINDIKAFFQFSNDMRDVKKFGDIYYKLGCKLSKSTYKFVCDNIDKYNNLTVFEILQKYDELEPWVRNKLQTIQLAFMRMRDKSPFEALKILKYDSGYMSYIFSKKGFSVSTFDHTFSVLLSVSFFCNDQKTFWNRLHELAEMKGGEDSTVVLSTIHSAKGQEYDYVIIIDAIDGIFPPDGAIKEQALLEEERRLFYVAITRAKNQLEIIVGNKRFGMPMLTSQFIDELKEREKEFIPVSARTIPIRKSSKKIDLSEYSVGMGLNHKVYGNVTIAKIDGTDAILVSNQRGSITVDLEFCLANNIVMSIEPKEVL